MARFGKMTPIGEFVTKTVAPIGQQYGFLGAAILLEWEQIAGQFASYCQPIRVTFPFQQRRQGQLHVRVTSSMAAHLVYYEPQILEKINQYFGYEAISRITKKHEPVFSFTAKRSAPSTPLTEEQTKTLAETVAQIEDDELRNALLTLGQGIEQRK